MNKLSTMCLNKIVIDCDVCKSNYPMIFHKCVRLADKKMKQLEAFAIEIYCQNIAISVLIDELEEKDQDLYYEIVKFMNGEN